MYTEQISNIVDQVLEELRSKVQDSDYTTSTLQNKMDEIEEVKQELSDATDEITNVISYLEGLDLHAYEEATDKAEPMVNDLT